VGKKSDSESEPNKNDNARGLMQLEFSKIIFIIYNISIIFFAAIFYNNSNMYVYLLLIHLSILFGLGEMAVYPFNGRQRVSSKPAFYASLLIAVFIANSLQSLSVPDWYPIDSPILIFIPLLVYGFATVLRGCLENRIRGIPFAHEV
jgi:hypothetical protein